MTDQERDYEKEAKREGWVPPEEYKGEGDGVEAKEFVERGEKFVGIMKSKVERLEGQIQNLTESNKQFKVYHDRAISKEQDKTAKVMDERDVAIAKAIDDSNGPEYIRLNKEQEADREILRAQEAPGNDGARQHAILVAQFQKDNSWYNGNKKLQIYADGLADGIIAEGYQGQAYFNELARRVEQDFPEEFENKNRSRANSVEAGGEQGTEDKPKSFEALPAADKATCERFEKNMGMTTEAEKKKFRKEYLANYEWDQTDRVWN